MQRPTECSLVVRATELELVTVTSIKNIPARKCPFKLPLITSGPVIGLSVNRFTKRTK